MLFFLVFMYTYSVHDYVLYSIVRFIIYYRLELFMLDIKFEIFSWYGKIRATTTTTLAYSSGTLDPI